MLKFHEFLKEKVNYIEITENDFFNSLCSELDKKYFPEVKYYRDDENDTKVHYAVELFNNGALGYRDLIKKLSKNCNDTEQNIHKIVKKYIKSFGDFDTSIFE